MKVGLTQGVVLLGSVAALWGCVAQLPALVDPTDVTGSLVVGRVVTVSTGDRSRRYLPAVQHFELEDHVSHQRFQVEINSHDRYFVLNLPPGQYRLTRVLISEGPFMSMADLSMTFPVDATAMTYVGTWKIGVDSPRYGRMIVASLFADQVESAQARDFLHDQYPTLKGSSMVETLPQPTQIETRLYEVMPYPRYPRYFRRHWW
jgi:hypothetical protein